MPKKTDISFEAFRISLQGAAMNVASEKKGETHRRPRQGRCARAASACAEAMATGGTPVQHGAAASAAAGACQASCSGRLGKRVGKRVADAVGDAVDAFLELHAVLSPKQAARLKRDLISRALHADQEPKME